MVQAIKTQENLQNYRQTPNDTVAIERLERLGYRYVDTGIVGERDFTKLFLKCHGN